jgi:pSer/pThr/pTyr-binding forkhead associated (FHA) protein
MNTWQVVLSVINGDLRGRAYVFERPLRCVVGRSKDCELSLAKTADFAGVSRHHCLLEINPPHITVRDLGSLNGTYINNDRIGGRPGHMTPDESFAYESIPRELHNDDVLRVGDIHFRVSVIEPSIVTSPVEAIPVACV